MTDEFEHTAKNEEGIKKERYDFRWERLKHSLQPYLDEYSKLHPNAAKEMRNRHESLKPFIRRQNETYAKINL